MAQAGERQYSNYLTSTFLLFNPTGLCQAVLAVASAAATNKVRLGFAEQKLVQIEHRWFVVHRAYKR